MTAARSEGYVTIYGDSNRAAAIHGLRCTATMRVSQTRAATAEYNGHDSLPGGGGQDTGPEEDHVVMTFFQRADPCPPAGGRYSICADASTRDGGLCPAVQASI